MSRVSSLFRLQGVDLQLDRLRARREEIDRLLGESEGLRAAHETLQRAEERLAAARESVRHAEDGLSANKAKATETETRLYGGTVHNPKELQDLQAEVEALGRYRATLEDRLLDALVLLEEAEATHVAAEAEATQVASQTASRDSALAEERAQIEAALDRLETEREAALANVTEVDLALYIRLRENRGGLAVAQIQDAACGACGLTLAHSLRQEIQAGTELTPCLQCGRILYAG
jgi:predicted  nucleic acid-binding Zn-ribbon protein